MRSIYTFILSLISPAALVYLWRKTRDGKKFKERLGYVNHKADIWLHASSVGEMKAAGPFIKKLAKARPDAKIVISTMTTTGYKEMQRQLGDNFPHFYFGLDLPFIWQRLLKKLKPETLIILEQELWPNLIHSCLKHKIKVMLINAKYSDKSLKHTYWLKPLFLATYNKLDLIICQSKKDREQFINHGVNSDKCKVSGNLKFDLNLSQEIIDKAKVIKAELGKRPLWVAGSTHKGEDEIILAIQQKILKHQPDTLLILAPRHPERFSDVYHLINKSGLSGIKYTDNQKPTNQTQVLLLDTLGKLLTYYGAADVALVAGSLLPGLGGHNLLEPAAFGRAVVSGKYLSDFKEIETTFKKARALTQIDNTAAGAKIILQLLHDKAKSTQLGKRALAVINKNQGATDKTLELYFTIQASVDC